jgi:gliding motility-associated-like protein
LKHAALILLFAFSRLLSQTGPPDLRCLEVLNNGDVVLTWIPTGDPGNTFSHYQVYSGIQKKGPFAPVSPTIAPVSATGMVHAAASASSQTIFYYVKSVDVNGNSSLSSDTLQTIFLNIATSATLNITYNNISSPPRPNGGTTFTLTKEYPAGSVNDFSVTSATSAIDVINVCDAKINYRVLLKDGSGCVSKSNTIFGSYDDINYPQILVIDSISVLPDGTTILAWDLAPDFDVDTYNILKVQPDATTKRIDSVGGRSTSSYIFNDTEANTHSIKLYVSAQDSCNNNPGPYDERPVTIHVNAEYDHCRYRTSLRWNPYQGMRNGIREYRIYYAVGTGSYSLVGTTQETSFVHDSVDAKQNVCYFVRVVNGDQSITASSNRLCFFTQEVDIPGTFYMTSASVNRSQHVDLQIYIDTLIRFAEIELQRAESQTSAFSKITAIPYARHPFYYYTDPEAEPGARPYYYKAILKDSCGNARKETNVCRTIFLQAGNAGEDLFKRRLSWSAYEGFAGGVQAYHIYRIVNDEPHPPVIATTNANVTTYTDNLEEVAEDGSSIAYYVQAVESPSSPYPFTDVSNSNISQVYVEGRMYVPNAFAPNGQNRIWKPVTHFVDREEYNVRVFNRWGEQVFHATDENAGWEGTGCSEGVYVYLISYKNARGEYREQKGTVLLMK